MRERLQTLLDLTKFRIAVLATFSTAAGYILRAERVDAGLLPVLAGTALLGAGSLALNQVQEHRTDALMERTRNRPIPSGRMSVAEAFWVSAGLLFMGLMMLWGFAGTLPLVLGLVCVVWYNGLYTGLKRWTPFAVIPGSVIGAIPPVIGWTAAGGYPTHPAIISLAVFFFVWQVPHFWLLLRKYGKDYEQARLSSLTQVFSEEQLTRLTFVWIVAAAVTCLSLPVFGAVYSNLAAAGLLVCAVWLVWRASGLLSAEADERSFRRTFVSINVYALLVMIIVSADRLVKTG